MYNFKDNTPEMQNKSEIGATRLEQQRKRSVALLPKTLLILACTPLLIPLSMSGKTKMWKRLTHKWDICIWLQLTWRKNAHCLFTYSTNIVTMQS